MLVYTRYRGCPAEPWFSGFLRRLAKPRVSLDRGRRGTSKWGFIARILDPFFRSLCRGWMDAPSGPLMTWTSGTLPPPPYARNIGCSCAKRVGCRPQPGGPSGQFPGMLPVGKSRGGAPGCERGGEIRSIYEGERYSPRVWGGRHRRRLHMSYPEKTKRRKTRKELKPATPVDAAASYPWRLLLVELLFEFKKKLYEEEPQGVGGRRAS